MDKKLTCIICPRGCSINIKMDGKEILEVTGYTCKRGEEYAKSEITNPLRTLTTTVATKNGGVVAVKTDKPIPKGKIFDCMKELNKIEIQIPVVVGQVIIENMLGIGANLVATQNLSEE